MPVMAETREDDHGMSFGSHIEALRRAIMYSVIPPVILMFAVWPFWEDIHYVISRGLLDDRTWHKLARLTAMDTFSLSMKISAYVSILISVPWIVFQLWLFIRPALRPQERRFVYLVVPMSIGLFLGGVAFGYFVLLPTALEFLLEFGSNVVSHDFLGIEYFYNLVFSMLLILGLTFQLPLIVSSAIRFGILRPDHITERRRILMFVSALLGAVLTPTGDPISMSLVAIPIYLLIEGGLYLGIFWKARADARRAREPGIADAFKEGMREAGGNDEEPPAGSSTPDGNNGGGGDSSKSAGVMEDSAESFASVVGGLARSVSQSIAELRKQVDIEDEVDKGGSVARTTPYSARPAASPVIEKPSITPASAIVAASPQVKTVAPSDPQRPTQPPLPSDESEKPVPQLPTELRRRIDAYIRQRLDEILDEVDKTRGQKHSDKDKGHD